MPRTVQDRPQDVEALRERLRKMSDRELRKFGQAASDKCSSQTNKPPSVALLVELGEAQAEWRRRLEAKSQRRREATRYTFNAATKIIHNNSQACILARTSKLSCKGCYVDTPTPLPAGTSFRMVISSDQGSVAAKGKVIHVNEGQGMGVEFVELTGDQLKTIRSWLPSSSDAQTPMVPAT